MKACFFSTTPYAGRAPSAGDWPVPPELCERPGAVATMERSLGLIEWAEELGFDWISISEHHYTAGLVTPNPVILAAAAAQRTSRVKLAVLGPLLPLAHPIRTAEELAMVDALCDGRLIVLFLRGTPNEHQTYRTNPDETRAMTQEGIELILRAWTEPQPFGWEGRFYRFRTISVWPRTTQDPHPLVFASGNSDDSIVFAAQHHLGLAIAFLPPELVRRNVARYRELCADAGWEPGPEHVLYRCLIHIDETLERARASSTRPEPPVPEGTAPAAPPRINPFQMRPQLFGGPAEVVQQARALRECGVGVLDVAFMFGGLDTERQRTAMSLFANRAMPEIREL